MKQRRPTQVELLQITPSASRSEQKLWALIVVHYCTGTTSVAIPYFFPFLRNAIKLFNVLLISAAANAFHCVTHEPSLDHTLHRQALLYSGLLFSSPSEINEALCVCVQEQRELLMRTSFILSFMPAVYTPNNSKFTYIISFNSPRSIPGKIDFIVSFSPGQAIYSS